MAPIPTVMYNVICTLLVICVCRAVVGVDVISSSKLETCIRNGTQVRALQRYIYTHMIYPYLPIFQGVQFMPGLDTEASAPAYCSSTTFTVNFISTVLQTALLR